MDCANCSEVVKMPHLHRTVVVRAKRRRRVKVTRTQRRRKTIMGLEARGTRRMPLDLGVMRKVIKSAWTLGMSFCGYFSFPISSYLFSG